MPTWLASLEGAYGAWLVHTARWALASAHLHLPLEAVEIGITVLLLIVAAAAVRWVFRFVGQLVRIALTVAVLVLVLAVVAPGFLKTMEHSHILQRIGSGRSLPSLGNRAGSVLSNLTNGGKKP